VPTVGGRTLSKACAIGVLVAAALVWSAGAASAGCGDYITVLNADGSVAGHPQQHQPPSVPCHGPNCSARQPLPVVPVTVPHGKFGGAEELAATLVVEEELPLSFASRVPLGSSGRPVRRTAAPFHPPRPV
jgi:hypothetical protein